MDSWSLRRILGDSARGEDLEAAYREWFYDLNRGSGNQARQMSDDSKGGAR